MSIRSKKKKQRKETHGLVTGSAIRRDDMVMVIAGGNSATRPIKGQVGKVLRFVGTARDRVVVEGVNMVTRHKKTTTPDSPSGKVQKEAPIHISNVMYYVEKLKRPVRLVNKLLDNGKKVRGYRDPSSKEFVQL